MTEKIYSVLQGVGIDVSRDDIHKVIKQRGQVAHGARGTNETELRAAADFARQWVEQALGKMLGEKRP